MSMSPFALLLLIASLASHPQARTSSPTTQSFISLLVSQQGLDFAKEILVSEAVSSLTSLHLPQIQKTLKIPFLGNIQMVLSNVSIYGVDVPSSHIVVGDVGFSIVASGISCNVSLNWSYDYYTWLVPYSISDHGEAYVQVRWKQWMWEYL